MNVIERLKISTVGQLARVPDSDLLGIVNFGKKSLREVRSKIALLNSRGFVQWPTQQQNPGRLNSQITRTARRLRRLKNAKTLLSNDPLFGHLIREMNLEAKNAREAADKIISRRMDPVDPRPLARRLAELVKIVQEGNRMSLEAALWSLTGGLGSERNRRIIISHLGWDGKPPRTLEAVGQAHNMTRERVRQICKRIENVRSSRPFAPALDRALNVVALAAPALTKEIEEHLFQRRLTTSGFSVESIVAAARDLGRQPPFCIEMLHGHRVVVPVDSGGLLDRIDHAARRAISHWGVATVQDIAAGTGTAASLTQKLLPVLCVFEWLDECSGWFWIANTSRNSLLTQVRKILAASPCIDVGELRTGVGRHHRKRGFAPPRRVLLELCRQQPWCRVGDERIEAAALLKPNEILSDTEQIILRVFKEHGPVLPRAKFEQLCLDAGMNHHSFGVFLTYCPLICRHAIGVYGLRGAEVPVGQVESLMPRRINQSKLIVDYGWMSDRAVQVLYRLSKGMLTNGIVSIPSALKAFVQRRFALMTGDNCKIGTLAVKDTSGWGLGPFYTRRGGEPGDYLSIVFNLRDGIATVQIGDVSLMDELANSRMKPANSEMIASPLHRPTAGPVQLELRSGESPL